MKQSENIYLIGLMGAGKSTIGRQLARTLHLPFYDSDKAIEETTGVDIPTIFEFEGEQGFRDREQKMLQQLAELNGVVIATGGGAILREENRTLLSQNGYVVYLYCSLDKIIERTKRDNQRPLLNTDNPREQLENLLEQREPLYLACADYQIDTGNMQSKMVVKKILEQYNQEHN